MRKSFLLGKKYFDFRIIACIIITLFFIAIVYHSLFVSAIKNNEFKFIDPEKFSTYEEDPSMTTLNNKDVLIVAKGSCAVTYGTIPFSYFWKSNFGSRDFELIDLNQQSIKTLEEIIIDGYNVYVLKIPACYYFKDFPKNLANNTGIILKNYSKTLCKVVIDFHSV